MKATPHAVIVNPVGKGISRNTFACFMGPNFEEVLKTPDGKSSQRVYKTNPIQAVPGLEKRWEEGITFEEYEQ